MSPAVRGLWGSAVVAACVGPSAAINVWPRLSHMISESAVSGAEAGITFGLIMSVVIMAAIPFAIKNEESWGFRLIYVVFGATLAAFNFSMAVDVAGKWRDQVTAPAALTAGTAAKLKSHISAVTAAINRLGQLPHTSAAQVDAANEAVRLATQARDQECGKVGRNCRTRVAELRTATEKRGTLLANRAVSERRETYETKINQARKELDALGIIPDVVDPTAARLGKVLNRLPFMDLGDRPDLVVIELWPTWIAAAIELMALLGPRALFTAMSLQAPGLERREPAKMTIEPPTPAPKSTALPKTPAIAAKMKNQKKIRGSAVTDETSVRQWKESRTVVRLGSEIRPKETWETAYKPWCEANGIEPVTLTKFGMMMKAPLEAGGCGVQYVERNKRGFYVDIALVARPRLVTAM